MAKRRDLLDWLYEALCGLGGKGRIADLCKYVYEHHEHELRASGDLFYFIHGNMISDGQGTN